MIHRDQQWIENQRTKNRPRSAHKIQTNNLRMKRNVRSPQSINKPMCIYAVCIIEMLQIEQHLQENDQSPALKENKRNKKNRGYPRGIVGTPSGLRNGNSYFHKLKFLLNKKNKSVSDFIYARGTLLMSEKTLLIVLHSIIEEMINIHFTIRHYLHETITQQQEPHSFC